MCVIIVKEKNQNKPSMEFLKKAWNTNPDGAGVMYVKNNRVIIQKGLMTFNDFWKVAKNLPNETTIVYHFRIATHGSRDKKGTHPFPISNNDDVLQKSFIKTNVGVAHNGIISLTANYNKKHNPKNLSDTQLFIRDYLYTLQKMNMKWFENKKLRDLVEKSLGSKMVLLTNNHNLYYFNDFVNVEGYKCSNNYFNFKYYNYYNYNYNYDYDNPTNYIEVPKNDDIAFFDGDAMLPIKEVKGTVEINKYNCVKLDGKYSSVYRLYENTSYLPLEYNDILQEVYLDDN